MPSPSVHVPVLIEEVVEHLRPAPGQMFADGTLGGGGHARALAERVLPGGRVIGVDLDPAAIERTVPTFGDLPIEAVAASYVGLPDVLAQRGLTVVDGILLDLGLSSDQLADGQRGFSFQADGPLDLRFDPTEGESASDFLGHVDEKRLADVIYQYGEERFSRRIARRIVEQRRGKSTWSAGELASVVRSCVPRSRGHAIDPATRTFQALRIAVNGELDAVEQALGRLPDLLRPGGRLAIISFHSLEDRLVKHAFRNDPRLVVVTKRPITATAAETVSNPRARSAKLRVAERAE